MEKFFELDVLFLSGNILIALATILTLRDDNIFLKTISRIIYIAASLLILFSTTPLLPAFFRFHILLIILLLFALKMGSKTIAPGRNILRIGILITALWSLHDATKSNNLPAPLKPVSTVYILGPTLNDKEELDSWSSVLHKNLQIRSVNLTTQGCTFDSLLDQARLIGEKDNTTILLPLVDKLTDINPKDFSRNLNKLLEELSIDDRTIIMASLPTATWDKEYLIRQRQLAKHHKVLLIPRTLVVSSIKKAGIEGLTTLSTTEQQALASLFSQQITY